MPHGRHVQTLKLLNGRPMHHLLLTTINKTKSLPRSSTPPLLSSTNSSANSISQRLSIPFLSLPDVHIVQSALGEGRGRQGRRSAHCNCCLINGHIQFKWLRRRASARQRFPCPKKETSCGTSQSPATPTTSESTKDRIKVDDRQITRRAKIHGAAPRASLPSSGSRDRKALPVSLGIQDEI